MSDEIQQWAFDRMDSLTYEEGKVAPQNAAYTRVGHAFARYIMRHEEPPVDKDVLAVRDILATQWPEAFMASKNDYIDGAYDQAPHFVEALAAYRKHKQ